MSVRKTRKLLTAALGVATVSYVAGCGRTATGADSDGRQLTNGSSSGATDTTSAIDDTTFDPGEQTVISGNLVAPPPVDTHRPDTSSPTPDDSAIISGNLVAPPPPTQEPYESTVGPTDSSFIAGNLLPPPSNWPFTEPPTTTEPPITSNTPGWSGTPVSTDGPTSTSSEPRLDTGQPDAQAPIQDASVGEDAGQ